MRKITATKHFYTRLRKRLGISSYNAGREVTYAIKYGRVLYSNNLQSYKILGRRGVYVLNKRLAFVTAYRNDYQVNSGYEYKKIKGWRLRMLKRKFYIEKLKGN